MDERHIGERGLRLALDRLKERVQAQDPLGCLIPLAEALAWLYSLHEWNRDRLGSWQFFSQAQGSADGQTLLGLIWARGAVAHRMTNVTRIVMDLTTSSILGAAVVGRMRLGSAGTPILHWIDEAAVPARQRPDRFGRDAMYGQHVGGQLLIPPLESAFSFLQGLS